MNVAAPTPVSAAKAQMNFLGYGPCGRWCGLLYSSFISGWTPSHRANRTKEVHLRRGTFAGWLGPTLTADFEDFQHVSRETFGFFHCAAGCLIAIGTWVAVVL